MTVLCMSRAIYLYVVLIGVQNGAGEECTQIGKDRCFSCEGRNLTYIPSSIPSSVEILDFSFNFLPTLQRTLFPQLNDLKLLDLTRCHIRHITDDAFHNVRNVTTLILTGNPVSYIGPGGVNSLYQLLRLVLVDTGLSSLNLHFNNLNKLRELNVGTNHIQSMAVPAFMVDFRDFSLLDLHANNISTLKINDTNVLRGMRGNITLNLSRNPILHIEPGAFQGIYLRELNIRGAFVSLEAQRDGLNALGGLNVGKLIIGSYREDYLKISEVSYLDGLCMINFKEIDSLHIGWSVSELHCIVNATKIALERGYITSMENIPFQQAKEIYIGYNYLPMKLEFSHLHSLEKLVVVENRYTFLRSLSDMPKLQHVHLSGGKMYLTECCAKIFRELPMIRSLNLSYNEALHMDKDPFSRLSSLEVLDLHLTRIGGLTVQFELFKDLCNLQFLDISYSDVIIRSTMTLGSLYSLKVLKMAGSYIQGDSLSYLFQNLTALEVLDISDSKIESIAWRTFKNLPRLKHLFLSRNRLMALDFLTHPNLKGLTILQVHTNNIASVAHNVLQNLPTNLSVFDLSFNPIDCSCSQIDFILWITTHQKIFPQSNDVLCKILSQKPKMKAIDFDIESCIHSRRLTIVFSVCAVVLLVLALVLVYRFQFYLRYGWVLLRGYRASKQQDCSYDAFVIYSSKDEAWVMDELVENLENGIPPIHLCLHVRDFEAGKAITSNIIDEGIMGSRKIIVVVSKHFIESSWCRFEFEVAQSWLVTQGNPNIIIIILEDVEEDKTKKVFGLHKHLKKNTYLKWSGNPISNIRFWIRLRKAVMTNY